MCDPVSLVPRSRLSGVSATSSMSDTRQDYIQKNRTIILKKEIVNMLDERLQELTEKAAQQEAEIKRLGDEIETLQIDCANKIAAAKVDFETKEINYKKQIKELTLALELRNSNEREKIKRSGKKSVNALWEEVLGKPDE